MPVSQPAEGTGPGPGPDVVDCQWHWHPTAFLETHVGRAQPPRAVRSGGGYLYEVSAAEIWRFDAPRFHDLETQVTHMERAGIDAAIVSPSVVGDVNDRELSEARELSLLLNEELSRAQALFPGRIHGLAVLPLADVGARSRPSRMPSTGSA